MWILLRFAQAIVISGKKVFMAGADIAYMQTNQTKGDVQAMRSYMDASNNLLNLIEDGPKPVVAAITGFALGGGLELAMVRVASRCGDSRCELYRLWFVHIVRMRLRDNAQDLLTLIRPAMLALPWLARRSVCPSLPSASSPASVARSAFPASSAPPRPSR